MIKRKRNVEISTIPEIFKDYPEWLLELIRVRQIQAGNPPNLFVFDNSIWSDKSDGGFDWRATEEGSDFWEKALVDGKFPKKQ